MEYGPAAYYHLLIEASKQAFADRNRYVADPACATVPVRELLSKAYAAVRRQEIAPDRAGDYAPGNPTPMGNTVYVTCVDRERKVVSLINSLFTGFGSGVVAGKRPQHTIISATILRNEQPWLCYGMMDGDVQP
jgi:gamma-glutamyltranspeptidase/glutathione hydrolase